MRIFKYPDTVQAALICRCTRCGPTWLNLDDGDVFVLVLKKGDDLGVGLAGGMQSDGEDKGAGCE
jgi:hypothetical protein